MSESTNLPDFAAAFVTEDKGRKLVYRAELGNFVGDRYIVTKIEMGVRLPADTHGAEAAHAELLRQVTALYHHVILTGAVPRHCTADRHRGRQPRRPQIPPELERELQTPPT